MTKKTAGAQKMSAMIRVSWEVYDELVRRQQEFHEETKGNVSLSDVVARALAADRKPVQP